MVAVKKIVLDVLKPHHPSALEYGRVIAAVGPGYHVSLIVLEVDENTETLQIIVEGGAIDFDAVQTAISDLGGSLHSVDEVVVLNEAGKE
jgi:hypothetical protein